MYQFLYHTNVYDSLIFPIKKKYWHKLIYFPTGDIAQVPSTSTRSTEIKYLY